MRLNDSDQGVLQRALYDEFSVIHAGSGGSLLRGESSLLARPADMGPAVRSSISVLTPGDGFNTVPALSAQQFRSGSVPNPGIAATGTFHINLEFDSNALAAPQAFRDGIQAAANIIEAALSDPITVNLSIHYSGTGGGAFAGPSGGLFETYSSVRSLLVANASPGDHTFDALPSGSTINGQGHVAVWNAELKALGLLSATAAGLDGTATFSTDIEANALVGVALHELTHAMGRVPYGTPDTNAGSDTDTPDVFGLFRFTSAGNYFFDDHLPAGSSYFSIDGGTTKLADYGESSDPSDFLNSGVQGSDDPFNEFYTPGFTLQDLTAVDLEQMVALGFHLGSSSGPDLTATGATLTASNFSVNINNAGTATAGASNTGIYLSGDSTITTGDLLLGSLSTGAIASGNHRSKALALAFSGAVAPGTYFVGALADKDDAVSEINESNNASSVIAVILGDNSSNTINGTNADNHIFGLNGNDTIVAKDGNDTVDGGDGDDIINMTSFFTATDRIDGGAGNDTVRLNGDYSAGVNFGTNTMRHVEKILISAGNDYKLTTHDSTVNSGQNMTVDASALASTNKLTFDGSAETNGSFTILGGAGDDSMTGSAGPDTMTGNDGADSFRPGLGSDIVSGGNGNDIIRFITPATLNAGDKIDGGADTDTVFVTGDYSAGVTFNATTMTNVEKIALGAGFNYRFTTNDATVAAGQTLTIDDTAVGAANTVLIKGSAETDGQFKFMAGAAVEDFTGGALSDTFVYTAASQSTSTTYDTIHSFNFTNDLFNIPGAAGTVTAIDTMLTTGMLDGGANFDSELAGVLMGNLGAHHAILFKADSGTLVNQTFLVVDLNGTNGYQSGADLVFHMLSSTGTLATTDFI